MKKLKKMTYPKNLTQEELIKFLDLEEDKRVRLYINQVSKDSVLIQKLEWF